MALNHFCDPEKNYYVIDNVRFWYHKGTPWSIFGWPRHIACSGQAVIDFGLKTEEIVRCDCHCHRSCFLH